MNVPGADRPTDIAEPYRCSVPDPASLRPGVPVASGAESVHNGPERSLSSRGTPALAGPPAWSTPVNTTTPAPSRIAGALDTIRREGRAALLPFVMAGYPTMATCEASVRAMVEAGADGFEIGIPFSDPIADGPTVQHAGQV